MAFYLYVPNAGRGGTIIGSFETAHDAVCEQAISGGQIVESPKFRQSPRPEYIKAGWKKCESCGRWTPPWHGVSDDSKVASECEGGK